MLVYFFLACVSYFRLHPFAVHAVLRQNEQEPVIEANRFIKLLMKFPAASDVVWRKPAANTVALQVSVNTFGEVLVRCRVADEARVELNRLIEE